MHEVGTKVSIPDGLPHPAGGPGVQDRATWIHGKANSENAPARRMGNAAAYGAAGRDKPVCVYHRSRNGALAGTDACDCGDACRAGVRGVSWREDLRAKETEIDEIRRRLRIRKGAKNE